MILRSTFIAITTLCAALAITGRMLALPWLHWVFKPLTMLVIITSVIVLAKPSQLRTLVLIALGLSLVGDVILMLPLKGFVYGLAAFLLALLVYATAFTREGSPKPWHFVALVILGAGLFITLRPLWQNLGALRIPVALYGAISCATIVAALVRGNPVAIAGAVLFTVSDSLLAYARFSDYDIPYPIELGSYFAAQLLLAMSLET